MAIKPKPQRHPQVRNPFERRKPKRAELRVAKELADEAGLKAFWEAKEKRETDGT